MKKILCTAVSALALAAFADGVNSTEFGVLYVPSTTKDTIVGVPWIASGTSTTDPVKVADLVLTAGLTDNDTLTVYDPEQGGYTDSWILSGGSWVAKQGTTTTTINRGSALKLTRSVYTSGFYIMGKPSTASGEYPMTLSDGTGPAYTLVALPFATDTSPNGTAPNTVTWTGVSGKTDTLNVPQPSGSTPLSLGWKSSMGWVKWNGSEWEAAPAIKAGTGMWFITTATTGSKKVAW